ncbi:MAG TPA: MucB/RseB C-terminal domain-containing protein [Casimicrobiaceae bacterium]|nr:MucB/RseB C-terminal domain-containing protein [Casimicrobiaceae bacterium]
MQHAHPPSSRARRRLASAAFFLAFVASTARADDAMQWLTRAAQAARELNYIGTILYQIGQRVETSRITHLNDGGREFEKLVNLDGPARELIRTQGEVRCYYPDAKLVRVEPRTFRNVFPSLSPKQQESLSRFYDFRVIGDDRVSGRPVQVVVFQPRDDLRYGHRFWSDAETGLLLKARLLNEKEEGIEQFAFTDISINAPVDRSMVAPSWPVTPKDWRVLEGVSGDVVRQATGWVVTRVPAGFEKIMEGFRRLRGRDERVAHLVFSDGLVSVSVFIEPQDALSAPIGFVHQGGLNVYSVRHDDHVITVMGETPSATVRQIANSVERR